MSVMPCLISEGGTRFFLGLTCKNSEEAEQAACYGRASMSVYHTLVGAFDVPHVATAELMAAELKWLARRHAGTARALLPLLPVQCPAGITR